MHTETKKKLVFTLIQSDLISRKIVLTFRRAGIDAENYFTDLCQVIFDLMDIPKGDENIYEKYDTLTEEAECIDTQHGNHALEPLMQKIYDFLEAYGNHPNTDLQI